MADSLYPGSDYVSPLIYGQAMQQVGQGAVTGADLMLRARQQRADEEYKQALLDMKAREEERLLRDRLGGLEAGGMPTGGAGSGDQTQQALANLGLTMQSPQERAAMLHEYSLGEEAAAPALAAADEALAMSRVAGGEMATSGARIAGERSASTPATVVAPRPEYEPQGVEQVGIRDPMAEFIGAGHLSDPALARERQAQGLESADPDAVAQYMAQFEPEYQQYQRGVREDAAEEQARRQQAEMERRQTMAQSVLPGLPEFKKMSSEQIGALGQWYATDPEGFSKVHTQAADTLQAQIAAGPGHARVAETRQARSARSEAAALREETGAKEDFTVAVAAHRQAIAEFEAVSRQYEATKDPTLVTLLQDALAKRQQAANDEQQARERYEQAEVVGAGIGASAGASTKVLPQLAGIAADDAPVTRDALLRALDTNPDTAALPLQEKADIADFGMADTPSARRIMQGKWGLSDMSTFDAWMAGSGRMRRETGTTPKKPFREFMTDAGFQQTSTGWKNPTTGATMTAENAETAWNTAVGN